MLFGLELKINQFADDTSLFLDGSQKSFEYCIETVLEYAKYSGLSMNFDKTNVVWFGCEEPPNRIYLPFQNRKQDMCVSRLEWLIFEDSCTWESK